MGAILEAAAALNRAAPGGVLMALDLGSKTIGVALSDADRTLASPLTTLRRAARLTPDLQALVALADARHATGFVLGLPRNMDGSEGPRCDSTRSFARNLARLDPRPILLWDERLTTMAAQDVLDAAGLTQKRRAALVDRLAAAHILEAALVALAGRESSNQRHGSENG
ncbi:MAG: Holliday junction resolvase RuvX [Pseudomonadota bacterium]